MRHMTRLIAISRDYWGWMALAFAAMLGATGANLAGPWLIRSLVGTVETSFASGTADTGQVIRTSLLLSYMPLKTGAAAPQVMGGPSQDGAASPRHEELYRHLQRLSPKFYCVHADRADHVKGHQRHDLPRLIAHVRPEALGAGDRGRSIRVLFSINSRRPCTPGAHPLIVLGFVAYNALSGRFRHAQARLGQRRCGVFSAGGRSRCSPRSSGKWSTCPRGSWVPLPGRCPLAPASMAPSASRRAWAPLPGSPGG